MKPQRLVGSGRRIWAALAIALVLVTCLVGLAAAGNPSRVPWRGGPGPAAIAGPDDIYIIAFDGSGTVSPSCHDFVSPEPYQPGQALLYDAKFGCYVSWYHGPLSGLTRAHDINALSDECVGEDPIEECNIYLSFAPNSIRVPGVGAVRGQDLVRAEWVPDTQDIFTNFTLYFDGSDVGLTTGGERIDAVYVLEVVDTPAAYTCERMALISTVGAYRVPDGAGGWLAGGGEDVLAFCGSRFGADTAGTWSLYHDGSAEGAPANALIALAHEETRKGFDRFDFLSKGAFRADRANGGHSEVFEFFGQTSEYRGPLFSFQDSAGISDRIDSFHIYYRVGAGNP
jgi:hypothetical protein